MNQDNARGQYASPSGEEGVRVLESMNEHHQPVYDWCLAHMPKGMDGAVLDIGCGGGAFISRMAERYPYAMFFGADISEDALEVTRRTNAGICAEGGLDLRLASAEDLPFEDGSFDLVTAVETYFFWPDLERSLGEVARVVSPGGVFVIGSEMQSDDPAVLGEYLEKYGARVVPDGELVGIMDRAGFDAAAYRREGTGIAAFVGVRRF